MRLAPSIVALFLCPILAGQEPAVPATLSLADALALARQNSPAYRQALNDRGPALWGVRNAWASFLPSASANGSIGYTGTGAQQFFTSAFTQTIATRTSTYSVGLNWQLSGATFSQLGLRNAQLAATNADIRGAETALVADVTQEYLTVMQARENALVAQAQLERAREFLKLAQARYDVGRATLIDVRQAQVARGQAEVALLRARTATDVEKLRLFQIIGVAAPVDVGTVQLTDTFPVTAPRWKLDELLTMAAKENPSLAALRARETAADWSVRSANSSYGPSLSASLGWGGYTQKFTDETALLAQAQAQADTNVSECNLQNMYFVNPGQPLLPCGLLAFTPAQGAAIRQQNSRYPFHFTSEPFQARLTISLPLFTNLSRPFQAAQARAQAHDLAESVRARGLEVRTQVSQAYLTLETAHRAIAIQDTNRSAAREQLQLATERYRVGSGTFFELLDAQVAQLNAEYDYVSAVYEYQKAVAGLEAAVGRPLR